MKINVMMMHQILQPTRTEAAHYQFVHGILTDILNLNLLKM